MAAMVNGLDYANFKNQVSKVQGASRAHLYHGRLGRAVPASDRAQEVRLRAQSHRPRSHCPSKQAVWCSSPARTTKADPSSSRNPSKASTLEAWHQPEAVACVLPDGQMPAVINGIPVQSWTDRPTSDAGWLDLAANRLIDEPSFVVPSGYRASAGVVVREKCGRVWVVAPSNAFGGYQVTFPKGTIEAGMTAQAAALVEAWEESGLQVRLLKHLVDVNRSQSYTRYYLAERLGGDPADMGWESQAGDAGA